MGYKIIRLEAENVKRLNAIDITPTDAVIVVGGDNDQGKSTTLDCISMAIGGGRELPEVPLRRGAKKGHITVDLKDSGPFETDLGDIIIRRNITAKGSTLVVTSKGAPQDSPQAILDKLYGKLTFDPTRFMRMSGEDQAEILKKLMGLDLSASKLQAEELYKKRTNVNRMIKDLRGAIAKAPEIPATIPDKEVSLAALMTEQDRITVHNNDINSKREKYKTVLHDITVQESQINETHNTVQDIEKELEILRAKLSAQQNVLSGLHEKKSRMEAFLGGLQPVDTEHVKKEILEVGRVNQLVREKVTRHTLVQNLTAMETESEGLTVQLDKIDSDNTAMIAAAKFPVPDLSFDPSGLVLFEGLPLSQCSTSKRLRVSTMIGIALNPMLRVMLLYGGNDLDDENMAIIRQIAGEYDMQIWVERRASDKVPPSVVIEDGYLKA